MQENKLEVPRFVVHLLLPPSNVYWSQYFVLRLTLFSFLGVRDDVSSTNDNFYVVYDKVTELHF